jgi:SAM-dependent methyltransferase
LPDSSSAKFICNICGEQCPRPDGPYTREAATCPHCESNVRVRSVTAILSRELFGVDLALPEMPVMKSIRGLGMSDGLKLAEQLEKRFDYRNTFYHQAPRFDVTRLNPADEGQYDFIISSEVMEHIPPPVERGFATLYRMLKPEGVLIVTVPYGLNGATKEHFPSLNEFTLAAPGGRIVLVNRKTDGTIETFDDLVFHGGPGSTLETRLFSQEGLLNAIRGAGFAQVEIASQNVPEYGVEHGENWSLPLFARKERTRAHNTELALEYKLVRRQLDNLEREHETVLREYQQFTAYHSQYDEEKRNELAERAEWTLGLEKQLEERTNWALALEKERKQAEVDFEKSVASERDAWRAAKALEQELDEVRAARVRLEKALWTRIGRKLGGI